MLLVGRLLPAQSLDKGYYVVVGAFATTKESYAQKFTDTLKKEGYDAVYAKDDRRNLLLVYVKRFDEFRPSIAEMTSTRKNTRFDEAWVRIIKDPLAVKSEEIKVKSEEIKVKREEVVAKREEVVEKEETSGVVQANENKVVVDTTLKATPSVIITPPEETKKPAEPAKAKEIPLVFHMFDANNSKPVEGKVEVVDTERARLMQKNNATDTLAIPDPKSKSGMLSFITDVFGYRKIQHEVNFNQPVVDSAKHYIDREGDFYVLQLEMVRYHKGDIATLYNVFFFNDAAIMMPESKYELNKLLDLMQSNPNYTIKLHGHTNGNARGKIVSMGPSKNFFSVNAPDVKQGSGSAKALSGQRAEVIREWLIAQGISGDRIEVKAWGGRRMIHDKNSNNARRNVRVEVEVLSE